MGLRTGEEYRESIRDGREVYYEGERVDDITKHPAFKPIVDAKARMYDMQFEEEFEDKTAFTQEDGTKACRAHKLPRTPDDLTAIRTYVETVLNELGGIVERVGDETIGELWSMYDAKDMLRTYGPQYADNVDHHILNVLNHDLYHVSGNTDPKGDRSKPPQEQDPDVLLHLVEERDNGIVVRGAKYETSASYAHQAFVKPTIADWDESKTDYALGFICDMNSKNLKHICRTAFGMGKNPEDYPISTKFDEIDTLLIFENVLIPWENVLFYNMPKAARYIRGTLHRYSAFHFLLRLLFRADLLLGTTFLNVEQTGLNRRQPVAEKLATLICYRETINAHLQACVYSAERSPGGLCMPNQSLLFSGRVYACSNLPAMVALARELAGGQVVLSPDTSSLKNPELKRYLDKYYTIGKWSSEDRFKLLHYTRDLVNSSMAGHKLAFELFAQSPPFAHLAAVYNNFDAKAMKKLVAKAANLSEAVLD